MMYPLVRELAGEGFPVTVTCGVLGFSTQAFYKWAANPICDRDFDDAHLTNAIVDIHADDPEFGYRFIADELERAGYEMGERPGSPPVPGAPDLVHDHQEGPAPRQDPRPGRPRRPGQPRLQRPGSRRHLADRHHRAPDGRGQALRLRHQGRLLEPDRRLRLWEIA